MTVDDSYILIAEEALEKYLREVRKARHLSRKAHRQKELPMQSLLGGYVFEKLSVLEQQEDFYGQSTLYEE